LWLKRLLGWDPYLGLSEALGRFLRREEKNVEK
jgi:hypothetical protein